jgi:hypothetical protein
VSEADAKEVGTGLIPDESEGGRVPRHVFVREVERRAADPDLTFFCVLDVTSAVLTPTDLEEALAEQVRADEGDIVSGNPERCAVLLQGARRGQLGPFLSRLRSSLGERAGIMASGAVDVAVLSHPADADRITALLGSSRDDAG